MNKSMNKSMNIEDAAAEVGLTVDAVRGLAERGLVTPDPKTGGYDAWRLAQLAVAKRARELGVADEEIVGLLSFLKAEVDSGAALEAAILSQQSALEAQLDELSAAQARLKDISGAA